MMRAHGNRKITLTKVTVLCSEHGRHVAFIGSLDDTSMLLASILKAWHEDHGMTCFTSSEEIESDILEVSVDEDLPF